MTGIKIIKTIPSMDTNTFEKALQCAPFWEACITDIPEVAITKLADDCMNWQLKAHFLLDPLGLNKIPVEVNHDLFWKEDTAFTGEGKKWKYWTENSSAVTASEGSLFFKPSGNDTKLMIEVTKLDLKNDFLDVAGLGKSMVITRLTQELQKMVATLIELTKSGRIPGLLEKCKE